MSERSVAVVTGAASGMGAATAAVLQSRNRRVIGIDLSGSDVDADLGDAVVAVDEAGPLAEHPYALLRAARG